MTESSSISGLAGLSSGTASSQDCVSPALHSVLHSDGSVVRSPAAVWRQQIQSGEPLRFKVRGQEYHLHPNIPSKGLIAPHASDDIKGCPVTNYESQETCS